MISRSRVRTPTRSIAPGARLLHVWLTRGRANHSSLDVVGHGFTLLTGIGGDGWRESATGIAAASGLQLATVTIGPACDYEDPFGDLARTSEIEDDGAIRVRPHDVVAWRARKWTVGGEAALKAALAAMRGK